MYGIFLDTETSGLNCYKHRILEIALKIINLQDETIIDSYDETVFQPKEVYDKSDPESLKVNGFSWEKIRDGKREIDVGHEIEKLFIKHEISRNNSIFICQNPSFDRAFFSQIIEPETQEKHSWPYHWLDLASMFWMQRCSLVDQELTLDDLKLSKNHIAKILGLAPEKMPHRAMQGVEHLVDCYFSLVNLSKTRL